VSAHTDYMRTIRAALETAPRWSAAIDPRDLPRKASRFVPDALQRADIVSTLRNALPTIDAVSGLRAARSLGALRNDPFYRDAVHAHLERVAGEVDAVTAPIPDPFTSRGHASRVTRSRKGRTSFVVDRRGIAQIIGATDLVTAPYVCDDIDRTERGWLTASLNLIPRKGYGRSSLSVLRVTDYRLARYGVDPVLGTDLTAFASMIDADVSDRSACAIQRCLISAGESDGVLDRFVIDDAPTSTRRTARFAVSRRQLRKPTARLSDPSTVRVTRVNADGKEVTRARFVPTVDIALATPDAFATEGLGYARCFVKRYRYVMPTDRPVKRVDVDRTERVTLSATHRGYWHRGAWHSLEVMPERTVTRDASRVALGTSTPSHLWLGHALVARGATDVDSRAASAARNEARTIGTVDAPSTALAWQTLADGVNRGECVKVRYADGMTRTLSRADDGRYALTLPDGSRVRARTSEHLANRAA
jgi:hypothetical protein